MLPLAHLGHALPMLPFFGPPLVFIAGLAVLALRDRRQDDPEDWDDLLDEDGRDAIDVRDDVQASAGLASGVCPPMPARRTDVRDLERV